MKHKLLNKLWLRVGMIVAIMTTALAGTAWAETETLTFSDKYTSNYSLDGKTVYGTNFSIVFDKNGGTAPQYYTNGTAVRAYAKNKFTVSSSYTITGIELTFGSSDGSNTITTDVGSYSNGTWEGSANSVTFTIGGSSGNRRLAGITVTYSTGGITPTCATPTFSPAAGSVESGTEVTISSTTEGATIYYTTDGTDPTTSSSVYSSPIEITEATTIKAFAAKSDYNDSEVATAEYTIKTPVPGYVIDFESDLDCYTDWKFTNIGTSNTTINAHGGSTYGANINDAGSGVTVCSIATNEKVNPETLTFYISKVTGNTTASYWYVEVSEDGSSWTQVGDAVSATNMSLGTWNEVSRNLSVYTNVYVRIRYGSSSAIRAIDDITLEMATPKVLSSIALSGEYPTTFHVGDAFSSEGIIVTATYESGKTADVTASATFTGYDMATAGEQTVTVSYTEGEVTKTATYTITVNAPATLTSITLSGTYPTEFEQGDAFSSEGIVVTANYDDDTTSDVTTEATFSGYDMATLGEQTVTISYGGKTATYTITVVEKKGTEENPYTVAQARAAIDASSGTQGVYATGIVTAIPTAWSTQYNNITFNFVDAEGDTDFLQAFRCVSTDAADASTVAVGDVVVVFGNLKKFNSTYEFDAACQLVSLTKPAVAVEAPTFSPVAGTYAEAQSVTLSCETEDATIYYTTDGTEPTSTSTQYTETITVSSTTTIKAVAVKGSDESSVASATYFICSADNPYTVTEALAFPEYPANGVYVSGIVSTAPTQAPTASGQLTYYISADGEASNQLQVYKGKGLEQAAFEAQDDIQVGDIVTIFGNVKIYNGTKEFDADNYLVSFERPVGPVENPTLTIANPANVTITATFGDEILVNGDDATVESGTEITLFVTLATDYNLESLTVTGEGGQNVELTQGGDFWTFTMPEYSVTVNATASAIIDPATSHTYELVTDASTLAADDVIIIVYNTATIHKAMGAQNDNNRAAVDVTQSGTQIIAGNTVQQITLEGNDSGWYFNVGNGYLYAASSSKNWLRTEDEKDDNAKATISISSDNTATITFQGTNTRNKLQYNNNDVLFSCYASTQKPVQIYRLVETPEPETEEVSVTSLKYSTYASDNALDFTESDIKAFYATVEGSTLTFHQIFKVPAGTGVLLYSPTAVTENIPVFTGTADEVTNNVFVRGTGVAVSYTETDKNYILFEGSNGIGFYKAKNNTVATNRAYIHVPASVNGVKYFTIDVEDDATGIENLNANVNLNEGAIYNLAGQRLQKMQKGINIVNGKKILK